VITPSDVEGKLKFVDMFCGIGTVRMGFEQAGHECVYSIEWDKFKRGIYNVIFGNEPEGRDIRECRAIDIPQSDCWTFGAPCQDFSLAGARSGLEGDRSSLVREVFRLVRETKEEYRPKWLLYENVGGMLSSNKGLDYFKILIEMESLGYDIEWQMLNSKDFGVPQNRERVFTLGHLRGQGGQKIFPIGGITESANIKVIGTTAESTVRKDGSIIMDKSTRAWVHDTSGIIGAIGAMEYKQPKQILVKGQVSNEGSQAGKVYGEEGIFPTICAGTHGYANGNVLVKEATKKGYAEANEGDSINLERPNSKTRRGRGHQQANTLTTSCNQAVVLPCIAASRGRYTSENSTEQRLEINKTGNSNTITTVQKDNLLLTPQSRIRRLTPKECWRLQGIDDSITNKVMASKTSDTQMYRGAGDACTVNVIYEIAKRLI